MSNNYYYFPYKNDNFCENYIENPKENEDEEESEEQISYSYPTSENVDKK